MKFIILISLIIYVLPFEIINTGRSRDVVKYTQDLRIITRTRIEYRDRIVCAKNITIYDKRRFAFIIPTILSINDPTKVRRIKSYDIAAGILIEEDYRVINTLKPDNTLFKFITASQVYIPLPMSVYSIKSISAETSATITSELLDKWTMTGDFRVDFYNNTGPYMLMITTSSKTTIRKTDKLVVYSADFSRRRTFTLNSGQNKKKFVYNFGVDKFRISYAHSFGISKSSSYSIQFFITRNAYTTRMEYNYEVAVHYSLIILVPRIHLSIIYSSYMKIKVYNFKTSVEKRIVSFDVDYPISTIPLKCHIVKNTDLDEGKIPHIDGIIRFVYVLGLRR